MNVIAIQSQKGDGGGAIKKKLAYSAIRADIYINICFKFKYCKNKCNIIVLYAVKKK